jgi:hypothetical protein
MLIEQTTNELMDRQIVDAIRHPTTLGVCFRFLDLGAGFVQHQARSKHIL